MPSQETRTLYRACSALSLAFGICHLQKQLGSTDSDPVLPVLLKHTSCSSPETPGRGGRASCSHTRTAPRHSVAGMTDKRPDWTADPQLAPFTSSVLLPVKLNL